VTDDQFTQALGEAVGEAFFARIPFWTFSAVSGAVVVHVAPLFDLAHQRATTMAAANEAGEGKVVFALSMLLLVAAIQDFADSDDVDQSFRSHADQIGAKRRRALLV
jgi:hypothetical protein